ncbi:ABC transporter ATP-binding protein [Shewanella sp. 1_MG-2023]|uniref:ABC transporter ATP-binding protein n=1 Tax=unclassified Shewanella TaxID=196818 RepID=UPI0026E328C0|nr:MULTISPECIES: ABC transporter ATP-binding protein [unclassified Shewanella]MDO6612046.1 ABC transporter ATP-binding protein [Shewanella sp. 7_MG-2023]MDO6771878.1 ABC transporter ATP-binding protein [Shewanella sp. 2_MG-2023]MDO6794222.1 ABC transporter ATP-binding protein [Shewanella sp. 1_MG-2023]
MAQQHSQTSSKTEAKTQQDAQDTVQSRLNCSWLKHKIVTHKRQLIQANLIAVLATLLSLPIPMLMPLLVDEVLLGQTGWLLNNLQPVLPEAWHLPGVYISIVLVAVIVLRLLTMLTQVVQAREFTKIAKRISLAIRQRMLLQLPQIKMSAFDKYGSAGLASRCITDVDTVERFVSDTLSRLIISVLTIVAIASVLLWLNWQLGLMIILLNPLVIYFSSRFAEHVKSLRRKENAATEAFQQALVDTVDATRELRLAQQEKHYYQKVFGLATDLSQHAIANQWKTDALNKLSFTTFLLGFECFRAMAIFMVLVSDLTVGQIFAVFSYLWYLMGPIQELLNIQYARFGAQASMERLNHLLELDVEIEVEVEVEVEPRQEKPILSKSALEQTSAISIDFNAVSFGFEQQPNLFQQLNLNLKANESIALLAMSGGGKSTLINLLLGFYTPHSGQIMINGEDIHDYGINRFRQQVGYVPQHPKLIAGTLRDNLTFGIEMTDEQLWQALAHAELSDTVSQWQDKLDTDLGRSNARLSGGQMQRLAIARMWLSQPQVVILDEATSALDAATEAKILSNLKAFLQQRTAIIIAHRLNNLRLADRIFVLDDGKITQSGTEQSLKAQPGLFKQLYVDAS